MVLTSSFLHNGEKRFFFGIGKKKKTGFRMPSSLYNSSIFVSLFWFCSAKKKELKGSLMILLEETDLKVLNVNKNIEF